MRFSIVALALSGGASALPALSSVTAHQPADLVTRKVEFKGAAAPSLVDDMNLSRVEAVAVREESIANANKRSMILEPRQAAKGGNTAEAFDPKAKAIGDNKENPTTGLTDSEAAEIVTSIDFKDKKAPGSLNAKGQRNPLPGLTADMTDAIIKQGQAALKEAGA
ncbi:uncharacterized protein ColSpa_10636 [Colletotrichum spaethianum]|uniref:Uncharacterized protein n=1 Tax=Colletotrichum spaethianum TaxID=700344 RepID=A0AA37PE67_9PEZI|nr:uncharacterized protein ColSpa_10636 [Colletotrichum spaethianum]GKT50455.1 hypothetical protein ColSpa_10636 [Colletotrichum spaethianum]